MPRLRTHARATHTRDKITHILISCLCGRVCNRRGHIRFKRQQHQGCAGDRAGRRADHAMRDPKFRLVYGHRWVKTVFLSRLYIKNDHFTKTGSGQT